MASDREERNKAFGIPKGTDPHARKGNEQQRILGMPADWYGPVNTGALPAWASLDSTTGVISGTPNDAEVARNISQVTSSTSGWPSIPCRNHCRRLPSR